MKTFNAHRASESDEWYTPPAYIDAARQIMGGIDCAPASNDYAQQVVRASVYFTKSNDGLSQQWQGRVWMNPPYSDMRPFATKLLSGLETGETTQAVLLCIASVSAAWWQALAATATVTCFVNRRVACYRPDGTIGPSPAHSSSMFYFGDRLKTASRLFGQFGVTFSVAIDGGKRNRCEVCRRDFAGRSHRRYCSPKCRVAAHRENQRMEATK